MSSTPTPYNRQANFVTDAQGNANITVSQVATELDAEFDAINVSLDQTQSRLSEIQRDDGKLQNGIVDGYALSPNVTDQIISDYQTYGTSTPMTRWAFTGTGSQTTFATSGSTLTSSTNYIVTIDGVTQDPASYTVLPDTITFSEPPPSGTAIVIVCIGYQRAVITPNLGPNSIPTPAIIDGAITAPKIAPITATGSTTARSITDRFADVVNVKDFGAVGDGVTDDTAAIQAAIQAAVNGGIVFCPKGTYYIASDLWVKTGVTLQGTLSAVGEQVINGQDPTKVKSALWVSPSATIKIDNGSAIKGLVILNNSLKSYFQSAKTPATVLSAVASFSGTGVTIIGSDAGVFDCLIGGFSNGIQTLSGANSERLRLERLMIDSTNGVVVNLSADVSRFYSVHCWPWVISRNGASATWSRTGTTVTVTSVAHGLSSGTYLTISSATGDTGVNNTYVSITVTGADTFTYTTSASGGTTTGTLRYAPPSRRQGSAFKVLRGDGLTFISCFSYGWDIGFDIQGPYGQFLSSCAADGGALDCGQVGLKVSSNATYGSATAVQVSNSMFSGLSQGSYVNGSSARVAFSNCEFHGNDVHLKSDAHNTLNVTGNVFLDHPGQLSVKKSLVLNNTSGASNIIGNTFGSGIAAFTVSSAAATYANFAYNTFVGSTSDSIGQISNVGGTGGVGGNVRQTFYANTTSGIGHIQNFYYSGGSLGSPSVAGSGAQPYKLNVLTYDGSTYGGVATIYTQLSSAPTSGSTPGRLIFSTNTSSLSPTDRIAVGHDGVLYPLTDNAYTLGTSGARWSSVWAANATIQTSDERTKKDIENSPLGLDFINALRPVAYRFKVGSNKVVRQVYRDAEGNEVDANAEGANPAEIITEEVAGQRVHYGLLAQEVKAALPEGVDFGGWILTDKNDPTSEQGLRYEEFIAPIIKAVQEVSEQNKTLANVVNNLVERIEALESK